MGSTRFILLKADFLCREVRLHRYCMKILNFSGLVCTSLLPGTRRTCERRISLEIYLRSTANEAASEFAQHHGRVDQATIGTSSYSCMYIPLYIHTYLMLRTPHILLSPDWASISRSNDQGVPEIEPQTRTRTLTSLPPRPPQRYVHMYLVRGTYIIDSGSCYVRHHAGAHT